MSTKTIKNKKVMNFWRCDLSNTNWALGDISCDVPSRLPLTKKLQKFIFSLNKFSIIHSPSILLIQICFYTTLVWNTSIPASITEKMNVYYIFCTEQIGDELGRYLTVMPICVLLMTTSKLCNFPIFNQILLKLSSHCFSNFPEFDKTNLISGWTFPLSL